MADITIIRNGARISLANFPKLGSGSENISVAVSASGAYDTYTTELYYGWYQGSSMQKMLAQYQNGLYYIPSNALFNAGNVYLTLRLVSGGNKVSTNTIPITIEKSAVNNEYSILPATETWQKAVDNYLNNSINLLNEKFDNLNTKVENEIPPLNKRLDNLVANTGNSNSEIVDARVDYENATYASLYQSITGADKKLNTKIKNEETARDKSTKTLQSEINTLDSKIYNETNERINEDVKLHEKFDLNFELKNISLGNVSDEMLVDKDGNTIGGLVYLPKIDDGLSSDVYPPSAKKVGTIINDIEKDVDTINGRVGKTFLDIYESIGIPVLYLNHENIPKLNSKADGDIKNVPYSFPKYGLSGQLKSIKVQGSSSQRWPKKNYTLKFKEPVTIVDSWGEQNKYVVKADWIDFSHLRNIIGAKTWANIRKKRIDSQYANLVNADGNSLTNANGETLNGETRKNLTMGKGMGAIDGFPICITINGEYWGLFLFSIPKDGWMASMGDGKKEAIVSGENHTNATRFNALPGLDENGNLDGVDFSVEYVTDENNQKWVADSLTTMISSVMQKGGTKQDYIDRISPYLDLDSAMDYFILVGLLDHWDGTGKNYLLDTWDGTKWSFMAYDMDTTFGNNWLGDYYIPIDDNPFKQLETIHRIFHIIYTYMREEFIERYKYLRSNILSDISMEVLVWNYAMNIPLAVYNYEPLRWPTLPYTSTGNVEQLLRWYKERASIMDKEIEELSKTL